MGVVDVAASVLFSVTGIGLVALLFLLVGPYWLLYLHTRLREAGKAREASVLSIPLPSEEDLPHVCVQLPIFNEGVIIQRALRAVVALDWPPDRLHIQVLDDSTDDTVNFARDAAAAYPNMDIAVLHREDRSGFKAGALQAGMEALPTCEYFAIFDVDYLPSPDFLRLCMRPLLIDPHLAFAQARFDYLNVEENALTQMQGLLLDAHLGVEQATRSWAGHMLPFNGTCGIWRRAAIDAAGGWRGDTLAEDLDLSYRAWLAGWHGMFLLSVAVPGELPSNSRAWTNQQRRWAKGFGEVARRMNAVLQHARKKGWQAQLAAFLHLGGWWSTPIAVLTIATWIATGILRPGQAAWLLPPAILVILLAQVGLFLTLRAGNRVIRQGSLGWRALLFRYVHAQVATVLVVLRNLRGYWDAILARGSVFQRTPKQG